MQKLFSKQKGRRLLVAGILCALSLIPLGLSRASAATADGSGTATSTGSGGNCENGVPLKADDRVCCPVGHNNDSEDCFFAKYINPTVKVLSAVAALAAVIGIMIGSIQYASSGGDPQKVAAGKGKIVKAIYGLVAFLFLYSALQFFTPGGVGANPAPVAARGGTTANQCAKPFLGLKPWFAYLPNDAFKPGTCDIEDFSLFGSTGDGSKSNIFPVLLAITDGLVRIAALVAVAYVIIAGIKLTTSQGEPDKAKQARETIINALIGLVMAVIAAAVVSYIGNKLSK